MNHLLETLYPALGQWFSHSRILFETKNDVQSLVIFENDRLGRVLMLDGVVQTTEADEFVYHEMMAHVPLLSHPNPKSVLIIGGGDGALLREVLKHSGVQRVVMVEIDPDVVTLCREYLPKHSQGSFDDPRLTLVYGDGAQVVHELEEKFDVILSDSTDPEGPAEGLFESSFYQGVARCLRDDNGIFVAQNGVPFFQENEVTNTYQRAKQSFRHVGFYAMAVPTYYGGLMTLAMASNNSDPLCPDFSIVSSRFSLAQFPTRYYTPSVHQGALALPPYIQDCIPKAK